VAYLFLNLGTPEAPEPQAVGRYLKEFLMDASVVDIPTPLRWFLVNVLIVPRRKFKSAEAYSQVWGERGSPLMTNSMDLLDQLRRLSPLTTIEIGMRYGQPSVGSALKKLRQQNVSEIRFFPLYPQYALSSTKTAILKLTEELKLMNWRPKVEILRPFYAHPKYIALLAQQFRKSVQGFPFDHVLMSYHGLPKRHLTKISSGCLQPICCDSPSDRSETCYRYQALQTSRQLARAVGLGDDQWSVSFQSRLGPGWIEPFTDKEFTELPARGRRNLVVVSPSFVADCLETLEEIEVRGRELFQGAGGEGFRLVPALNADPSWARTLIEFAEEKALWQPL